MLLYVNGLPLGQLELKNPSLSKRRPQQAVNQVAHYRETIPASTATSRSIGVSDLLRARVGTITTPAEHFAEWKSMDPAAMAGPLAARGADPRGVFTPARLLDLIRNFVLFETDGAKTWKVMAKYHQVDAVNRAVEPTAERDATATAAPASSGTRRAPARATRWCSSSTKLRRDKRFANPTIVCVTDTNDLDNQLVADLRAPGAPRARRAAGRRDRGRRATALHELLDVPAGGIVFTTIQKFGRRGRRTRCP